MLEAKSSTLRIKDKTMDYVVFGKGQKNLIILPGLSDGLKTVKGTAFILSRYYKKFQKDFKVYIFSRINEIHQGYSTREMARDINDAMNVLNIQSTCVMGISMGGMVAQYLAIDYPEKVERLIIGVSISRPNETINESVNTWIDMAQKGSYGDLTIDTMEKTFTDNHLKKYKPFYWLIRRIGKPKSFDRFLIQAHACLEHNAYDLLNKIETPTLVIGGDSDQVVGKNTSEEMADRIIHSKKIIYSGLGHGAYEESKTFNEEVYRFLTDEK